MKLIFAVLGIVLFSSFFGFLFGVSYGAAKQYEATPEKVVYHYEKDVYTVLILRNCLQQLKELKGGE